MDKADWLEDTSPAFRLMIATSWLAPESWRENQEKAIREAVGAGPDWAEYLQLVDRHQVAALSWAAIDGVRGITVPEPVRQKLRELSDACRIRAIEHCLMLTSVLKELNRVGIPVMPLKGQALSFHLYGDVGLRQSADLDIAVVKEDLPRAKACLERIGWQAEPWLSLLSPRQWEGLLAHRHDMSFERSGRGCTLELHWCGHWETPGATSGRWTRSHQSLWQGCSIQVMSPSDLTLYLCRHGDEHAWYCAKWVGDLARAHSLDLLDWKAALDEAGRFGQENAILAGLRLLETLYGLPLPKDLEIKCHGTPPQLIRVPLQELKDPVGPSAQVGPKSLWKVLRMYRYERLLWPGRSLRDRLLQLSYCGEDFKVLSLPDSFYWAYAPLRPFLWCWRWLRQPKQESQLMR